MTDAEARKVREALVRSFFWEWIRLAERRTKEQEQPESPVSEGTENQRDRP